MDSDSRAGVTGMNGTYAVEPPVATEISHTTVDAVSSERSPEVRWSWKEEKRNKLVRRFRFQEIFSWKKKKGFMEEEEGLLVSEVLCGGMDGEERNHVIENELGQKRKRVSNSETEKKEDGVRHLCSDGAGLVLCDRSYRGCPQAYHPACVDRDGELFRSKGSDSDSPQKKRKTKSPSKSGSAEKILSPAKPSSSGGPDHMDVDPMRSGKDKKRILADALGTDTATVLSGLNPFGKSIFVGGQQQAYQMGGRGGRSWRGERGGRSGRGERGGRGGALVPGSVQGMQQGRHRQKKVNIFWDLKTAPFPAEHNTPALVSNIENGLRRLDGSFVVEKISFYGQFRPVTCSNTLRFFESMDRYCVCNSCGFALRNAPENYRVTIDVPRFLAKEETPESKLQRHIYRHVRRSEKKHVVIVTGDFDFLWMLNDLRTKGMQVMLAYPDGTNLRLQVPCVAAWNVQSLLNGQAPDYLPPPPVV